MPDENKGGAQPVAESSTRISVEDAQAELGAMVVDEAEVVAGEEPGAKADEVPAKEAKDEVPNGGEPAEPESESEEEEESEDEDEEEGEEEQEEGEEGKEPKGREERSRAERRIAKLTAQRAEAREKLEVAEERVRELEGQVAGQIGLHPDYLTQAERKQIADATALEERRAFLIRHIGVGYDDPKDEGKSLSAAEIAEELVAMEKATGAIASAHALYDERKKQMIEDMKAGRQLRIDRERLPKPKKKTPVAAPPAAPAAAPAKPVSDPVKRSGFNEERFKANGGGKDAAVVELAELVT